MQIELTVRKMMRRREFLRKKMLEGVGEAVDNLYVH
jgi:hypothetical protein